MTVDLANRPLRRPRQPRTPELDRRHLVIESGDSQTLGDFLDHLQRLGIVLARWADEDDLDAGLYEIGDTNEQLLAGFFDLDLDKIEKEKLALLAYVRARHDYEDRKKADE